MNHQQTGGLCCRSGFRRFWVLGHVFLLLVPSLKVTAVNPSWLKLLFAVMGTSCKHLRATWWRVFDPLKIDLQWKFNGLHASSLSLEWECYEWIMFLWYGDRNVWNGVVEIRLVQYLLIPPHAIKHCLYEVMRCYFRVFFPRSLLRLNTTEYLHNVAFSHQIWIEFLQSEFNNNRNTDRLRALHLNLMCDHLL